ncbi:hypothetical protein KQI84_14605 [bacterium]|nr:hypothetical protein [bacterium]
MRTPGGTTTRVSPGSLRLKLGYFDDFTTRALVRGIEAVRTPVISQQYSRDDLLEGLKHEVLDVALLPTSDFLTTPNLNMLKGAGISTVSSANMFLVLSKGLPTEIRRVLVDQNDLGAGLLAELLLPRQIGQHPQFTQSKVPLDARRFNFDSDPHDAYILAGENALLARRSAFSWAWDLSQGWFSQTNAPYVMHVWACRRGINLYNLDQELTDLAHLNTNEAAMIAQKEAERLTLPPNIMTKIYQHALRTPLGEPEIAGLRTYVKELGQARLLPGTPHFSVYRPVNRAL